MRVKQFSMRIILFLTSVFISGCASMKDADLRSVETMTQPRIGIPLKQYDLPEESSIRDAILPMLTGELTMDSALRVGLLNNAALQAVYQELGIARADLLQSTLFKNPRFEGHARVPHGDGNVNTEFVATQDFMDILLMPLRKDVASAQLEEAKLRVGDAIVNLVAEIKIVYVEVLAAEQQKAMRKTVLDASEAAMEVSERLYAAGNINAIERDTQRSHHQQAVLDFLQSESTAKLAREPLNRLLGLKGNMANAWSVQATLPEIPSAEQSLEVLEELALRDRLDYAALKEKTEVSRRALRATRLGIIPEAEIGYNTEREPENERVTGPMWNVVVPLFDWKQAATARAESELRLGQFRASAFEVQVLSEVRQARERLLYYRNVTQQYKQDVIPTRQKLVESLQQHYNFMLIGVFQLIEGKQEEIQARREYIEALKNYWVARTELERAVGGRLTDDETKNGKEVIS